MKPRHNGILYHHGRRDHRLRRRSLDVLVLRSCPSFLCQLLLLSILLSSTTDAFMVLQRTSITSRTKSVDPNIGTPSSLSKRSYLMTTITTTATSSTSTPSSTSTSLHVTAPQDSSATPSTASYSSLPPAISVENLSCTHNGGETYQLQNVNYVLPRGAKVALIGRNGAGKSTFLNILAEASCRSDAQKQSGAHTSSSYVYTGTISCGKDVRVAHVEQEPPMPSDVSVGDAILGILDNSSINDTDMAKIKRQPHQTVLDVVRWYKWAAEHATDYPDSFTDSSAAMDARDGWSVLTKAEELATKLRIFHLQDQPLSQLSGGERKRVALCASLVEEPDVLLLDEPTNFLSLAGVQWLADLLLDNNNPKLSIVMVTHDRAFLEEVCNRILELDRGQLYEHEGSYSSFLQAKEERLANEDAAVQAAKAKYRVELEWMRRQPQARESKSKARIDAFYKLEKSTKPRPRDPNLVLGNDNQSSSSSRLGTKIISMRNVNLKFGDRVMLDDFNYDFCPGDRICLAGANGVGKTTFTKLITGEQPADSGEIEVGETVVLGVYDQLGLNFDPDTTEDQTVLDFVVDQVRLATTKPKEVATGEFSETTTITTTYNEATTPDEARRLLNKFEFPRSRWNERVKLLSGGERRRLQLLSVLSLKPNVLLLDEPSVDCDMDTLSALETFLNEEFKGVLLIVSHDRSFADKVTDHLFVFEGNGAVKDFQGSLSEYASCLVELENEKIQTQITGADSDSAIADNDAKFKNKLSYKEEKAQRNQVRNFVRSAKKEMTNIERSVEKLKQKVEGLQHEIDTTSSDEGWSVLAELTDQMNALQEEIDEKELRWLELAEELETMEAEEQ